jgi:MFS family permease
MAESVATIPEASLPAQSSVGPATPPLAELPIRSLRDLSGAQWKSGIAAWLGWLFDGLDMHLYSLVAAPFVMQLIGAHATSDPAVKEKSAIIQGAFLLGWALGGGFFGRLGDLLGRSRSLALTILTYAAFTGLSSVAHTWWELMIFRFVAALGIGGEWAVGSSLLSETWPKRWGPWIAAVLQTAVNIGVLLACATNFVFAGRSPRLVFLVGVVPALVVFWIRRAVPEPEEWHAARRDAGDYVPRVRELFVDGARRITWMTIGVCACSLTAWWAFMFFIIQHVRTLPDVRVLPAAQIERITSVCFFSLIAVSIVGNFLAGWFAKMFGYRRAIALMLVGMFAATFGGFARPLGYHALLPWVCGTGFFSGVFGLFTMYLPPLFPTLLRTTGAGFCYNIGRIAAAVGTIAFGIGFAAFKDFRVMLMVDAFLFLPAAGIALLMPEGNPTARMSEKR